MRLKSAGLIAGERVAILRRDSQSAKRGDLPLRRVFVKAAFLGALITAGCNSEMLEKQAEQIKQQEAEIERQRQEINALKTKQKLQEQKQRDCNRAFRDYFEKAQAAGDRDRAVTLYRDGLSICPDDEIAHFELGKVLAASGRSAEAAQEFEAALKIHPGFDEARRALDSLRSKQ